MQTHCPNHRPMLVSTKHTWTVRPSLTWSMPDALFLPLRIYKALPTDESACEAPLGAVVHGRSWREQSLVEHAGMRKRARTCGHADPATVSQLTWAQARCDFDNHHRDFCLSTLRRTTTYREQACDTAHKTLRSCHPTSLYSSKPYPILLPSSLLPFHTRIP
jgi:hypothetical protein